MKKIVTFLAFAIAVGTGLAQVNVHGDKNFTGNVNLDGDWRIKATKVTSTATELNQLDGNEFTSITSATLNVTGKSTLNGELEVNNSDVDINMTLSANEIDIAQTNAAGTASTPLIKVTDARTGATADQATEATLHITAAGAYGLTVADGIVQIEGEIDTASGDILLDPAGGEVHVDGGVHVGGTDAVGDNNLKVDGTSEFVGATTLAAHDIAVGELPAMTDGQVLLGDTSDSNANVVATTGVTFDRGGTGAVDAAYLTAGTVATAIDGSAITNVSAANLAAGTVATAIDISAATNIAAGNIASGDIASDRMTANAVVVTDFTQNGGILVGTGAGTFAEETGATLRASIDCPANSEVFGASTVTVGDLASGQLIATNAIVMLDTAAVAKSDYALIRVWTSETAYGPASTNNIEALTLSAGTAVATVTANADYWYVTSSGGAATAIITATADGTNYLNVSVGANVTTEEIILIP